MINVTKGPKSSYFGKENLDSISIYKENLYVTAKSTNEILIFNKYTLKLIRRMNVDGERPNGICIVDNLMYYTTVDDGTLHIFNLIEKKYVNKIKNLSLPYGVDVIKKQDKYIIVLACNKDHENGQIIIYWLQNNKITKINQYEKIGFIESIKIDKNKFFVADETNKLIFVFDMYFNLLWKCNKLLFKHDPEGIAIYKNFVIFTDQGKEPHTNLFYIFNKNVYQYISSFYALNTRNTDGIAIDQKTGFMYAIDNDKMISSFILKIEKIDVVRIKSKKIY